jgi:hypothetical protein
MCDGPTSVDVEYVGNDSRRGGYTWFSPSGPILKIIFVKVSEINHYALVDRYAIESRLELWL